MAEEYLTYHQRVDAALIPAVVEAVNAEVAEHLVGIPTIAGKVGWLTQRLAWALNEIDDLAATVESMQNHMADIERRQAGLE